MWLDALDGGPGLRPLTLVIGDRTIVVLAIAREQGMNAGRGSFSAVRALRCWRQSSQNLKPEAGGQKPAA
jgi:hypothetical protein